jgi:hypothetical protein
MKQINYCDESFFDENEKEGLFLKVRLRRNDDQSGKNSSHIFEICKFHTDGKCSPK